MNKRSYVAIVGLYNFGKTKRAADFRIKSFCGLNSLAGYNSYIIDGSNMKNSLEYVDDFQPLKYFQLGNSYVTEILFLFKVRKKIDHIQIYSSHFIVVIYYSLISKLFKLKTLLHVVEARSTFGHEGLYHYLNAKLYDYFSHKLVSKSIFITDYLRAYDRAAKFNSLVIPPISLSEVVSSPYEARQKKIVFVVTTGHLRLIQNVIEDFSNSSITTSYRLCLIISGDKRIIEKLKNVEAINYDIYSEISYPDMLKIMRTSYFGLLPLYDNDRDRCRYPNKIVDYLSAGLPLIILDTSHEALIDLNSTNSVISDSDSFTKAFNLISDGELNTPHKDMCINALALFEQRYRIESYDKCYKEFLA